MARLLLIWFLMMFHVNLSYGNSIPWVGKDGSRGMADCDKGVYKCVDSGEKIIDDIRVYKNCWRYEYQKKCRFPSKDDCRKLSNCYEVGIKDCLVRDNVGNCVNLLKEFSCKERVRSYEERKNVKQVLDGKEAARIVCNGIPCIDGNCIDKSYEMDEDILSSAAKLHGLGELKGEYLFAGNHEHCNKKPVGYMSCCKVKGWGKSLGAKCRPDELSLQKKREKRLCVYVGKTKSGTYPFYVIKHHFCCFGNLFNKVFQTQARKQLSLDFGDAHAPDCGGLTIEEISQLDFDKMDFSEFSHEIVKKMKLPNIGDVKERVLRSFESTDKESGLNK